MNKEDISYFVKLVEGELGIEYSDANIYQLEGRLLAFLKSSGISSLDELRKKFEGNLLPSSLRNQFFDIATNNETSFFRDKNLFDSLSREVFAMLAEKTQGKALRVWSMASSTGQEAVSLAMLLEERRLAGKIPDYSILLTDVSYGVLNRCREGVYSELEVSRGLNDGHLQRHFQKVSEGWKVRNEILSRFQYKQMNLHETWPVHDEFDLICLRNVLIYFEVAKRARIVSTVARHMRPHSLLVLGATENLIGISDAFEQVFIDGAYFYQLKSTAT